MTTINLWLDDVRPAPEGWLHVKTVADAITAMESYDVEQASLDHDLGDDAAGTGYAFVCWLEESGIKPLYKPTVHSANPVGAKRMRLVLDQLYGV